MKKRKRTPNFKTPKKTDENVTRSYFFWCLARSLDCYGDVDLSKRRRRRTSFCGKTINHLPSIKEEERKLKQVPVLHESKSYTTKANTHTMIYEVIWQNWTKLKLEKIKKKNSHSITFIIILKQYSICRIGKEWREKNEKRRNVVPSGEIWHASLSWITRTNREWCDVFENRFWKGLSALVCDLMIH